MFVFCPPEYFIQKNMIPPIVLDFTTIFIIFTVRIFNRSPSCCMNRTLFIDLMYGSRLNDAYVVQRQQTFNRRLLLYTPLCLCTYIHHFNMFCIIILTFVRTLGLIKRRGAITQNDILRRIILFIAWTAIKSRHCVKSIVS